MDWNSHRQYFVGLLFLCAFTGGSANFIWPCETNSDCTATNSLCSISGGYCKCSSFDQVFSEDLTQCLETSLYGEICNETIQCNLMPSGTKCITGVCDCADGNTYVRGRCRPLNGLNENCDTDLDCYFGYDRESVACQDHICKCANGYYHRHGNICRRKSIGIDDDCVVNTDCDEIIPEAVCVNLKCQLADKLEKNANNFVEGDIINNSKSKSEYKSVQSDSSSIEYNADKNPYFKSATVEVDSNLLNELPLKDLENNNLLNGTEDVNNSSKTQNVLLSKLYREVAIQTSIDGYNSNDNKVIAKKPTSTIINGYREYKNISNDATFTTDSSTEDTDDAKYGGTCNENGRTCPGFPHSICSNSVCFCKQGYYPKQDKCFAELGEIAETNNECEFTYEGSTKKCVCQKNYFYEQNLRSCRKPIQYHLSCTSNSQCSPFGASYCHPEIPRRCTCEEYADYDSIQQMCVYKKSPESECETNEGCKLANTVCLNHFCVCKDGFFEKNEVCVPGIGASCRETAECAAPNSECYPIEETTGKSDEPEKSCQCRKGYVHFKDECLKEAEELEDDCIESEQCKPLLGTCVHNKCTCTQEQHFKYGYCQEKKGIDEPCYRAGECFVEKGEDTVECRNSLCQCKFGYQADAEKTTCIRVVSNKKNSSGKPSALKIITCILICLAFLITSAALKQAYY